MRSGGESPDSYSGGVLPPGQWRIAGNGEEQGAFLQEDPDLSEQVFPALRFSKQDASASIYQTIAVEGGGIHDLEVNYRHGAPASKGILLKLAFTDRGSPNGSRGVQRFVLPGSGASSWQVFRRKIYIPAAATFCQVVLSFSSPGEEEAWVGTVSLAPEGPLTIPRAPRALSLDAPDDDPAWASLPTLEGFWKQNNPQEEAEVATHVRMAYDSEALYLQVSNDEPYPGDIRQTITERDGPVFRDDCNELFLSPEGGRFFQLITSAKGVQWDDLLIRKADGDPYRPSGTWSGQWKSRAWIGAKQWTSRWVIPWSDLDFHPKAGSTLLINFSRQRQTGTRELSQWNYFDGGFQTREKFATLAFGPQEALLKRYSEEIVTHPLGVVRPDKKYDELLDDIPGGYHVGDWAHAFYLNHYPPHFRKNHTPETWKSEQYRQLEVYASHGMSGPGLPWIANAIGWKPLLEWSRKWKLKYPYFTDNSGIERKAIANGAKYFDPRFNRVVAFDPAKMEETERHLEAFFADKPEAASIVAAFYGVDEPTNSMYGSFSRTVRKDAASILDQVDAEIQSTTGFGKYGLYDALDPSEKTRDDLAFRRIAFHRWWNLKMNEAAGRLRERITQLAPGVPFKPFTHNSVSGMTLGDVALLAQHADWVSADPYPTATLALYGRARALFHTGFTTKLVVDLSGGKVVNIMPQGFQYHGRQPQKEDVREWASQALKNGAGGLYWYTMGPTSFILPELYDEILDINRQVATMNRLRLPKNSRTAIVFSPSTQTALNDVTLHPYYTLYTLLGERLGSWFHFVSETTLDANPGALEPYSLIYLPQASYFSRPAADALLQRVREGATLVILDPEAFSHAPDGGTLKPLREALIGSHLLSAHQGGSLTTTGDAPAGIEAGWQLSLTPVTHLERDPAILAFDIDPPVDATPVATYRNGRPAAYQRAVGKGTVLYFAAQPFGNSDLATTSSDWEPFLKAITLQAGEPIDLPVWDFYLPSRPVRPTR
ncbi:MAG TPA: hypothetical protein VNQ90_13620 [Chthoniobacteraceae bacterium]|nr:hypothetical protein [Chthoniobacteraceae bacterium]